MQLSWKDIPPVPTSNDMLDIVLNRTQRKRLLLLDQGLRSLVFVLLYEKS